MSQLALDLEPLFVITPVTHFGVTIGPVFDIPVTGSASTTTSDRNGRVTTSHDSAQFYGGLTLVRAGLTMMLDGTHGIESATDANSGLTMITTTWRGVCAVAFSRFENTLLVTSTASGDSHRTIWNSVELLEVLATHFGLVFPAGTEFLPASAWQRM